MRGVAILVVTSLMLLGCHGKKKRGATNATT